MNNTSGSKKKSRQQTKTKHRPSTYVGIDLHKKTLQIEVQDSQGNVMYNKKIRNTALSIRREFACIPRDARCVIESSSVWYEVFRFIRDDLGYEVILSNPAQTKAIAASKKKTDKVDAHILADLLRGGHIAVSHVPDKKIIESRQMVRYRHDKVEQRTQCKNVIHGILLQDAITFPGLGTYTIDWGDGSSPSQDVENQQQHTYADAGNYMVSVSGDLSQIFNNCLPNAEKLISIEQWGDTRWSNMRHAFCGASQMTYDATDNPNLSSVSDMEGMFSDTSFNGDLYSWDVSSVTDMSDMFNSASSFNQPLNSWDVSSVTDMSDMFNSASSFNGDLSSWDVSSVTDMSYMFFYTSDFDGDLSGWDVSSVTDMRSMFLAAFDFNGDLSSWNISSVNNMSYMFSYSSFNGDLSGWDVSGVTYMEQMFQSASFNGNLGNWYITLDNASVTGILQAVGNITPQNEFLATHEPTYGIGSSSDSEHFGINGAALVLMTIPDANPAIVNITSTGDFGTSNSRIFEITILPGVADTTNPRLASIERYTPATENTDNQTLVYKATFSEDVTGVTVSDFTLSSDSAGGESTSTSTGQFTQTRSPHLTIPDLATVSDTITVPDSETATSVSVEVDITHNYIGDLKIDIIAPDGTSITLHDNSGGSTDNIDQPYAPLFGSIPISGVWTLQIHDRTAPDPGVLNSWTLTINYSTTTTVSPVTGISGSGDVYYVTVSAAQDGTYNLDLVSSGHGIRDAANNLLNNITPTTGTDETYTVSTTVTDTTNPRLASIERYSPAAENTDSQTLVYKVTFSENVTGVDTSDFTLSPGSTGNGTGSGQFTQTRTPAITIPYDQIVTDTILVTGSSTATSVSVAVDIAHPYIDDLKVDLIAPDGTVQTLHDRPSGPANIDQTYTPDFGSVSIAGNWTLQMHDDYSADDGILNSWMLTVNHDSDIATHVTSISGSGDVYYATLSAAQDGTYNLDLVSSDHSITDAAANPLTDTIPTTGTDETYTVSTTVIDTTNPRLASIERYSPTSQNTDSQSLIYEVTFSESVTGVTSSDFILSLVGSNAGTGSITGISGSGSVYYVTVSAAQDGTYNLDLVSSGHGIRDAANNLLNNTTPTTGTDETYTVSTTVTDTTNPRLASIERYSPAAENTDSQTLVYKVTFSENVTGVDASDFILSPDSTGGGTTTTSAEQFTQTRSPNLTIPDLQTVSDTITVSDSGTVTSVSVAVDITHTYSNAHKFLYSQFLGIVVP